MSKSLYVKITQGQALGPYSIYYDVVQPSNYAVLYGTTTPATNIALAALTSGSGLRVTIPDAATSVILQNANGDCLNYRDYAIVSFSNISTVCTGYYDGTATVNVTISGKSGQYQYSKDGGTTFSAPTTSKTYAFTNVSNGDYNIAVKRVADGVVSFYQSNPVVVNCAKTLTATYSAPCNITPPPEDRLYGDIVIYADGGSGDYQFAIYNTSTEVTIGPQDSNVFLDLNPTGQFIMYVYDVGNTVTPNYRLTVGTVTFNCPVVPDPLVFTATPGCGPTGYPGTGTVTAAGFDGGSEIYMFVSFGNSLQLATDRLNSPTERVILDGATSYTWSNLANNTVGTPNYYVGLQDSGGRQSFLQVAPVSCTTPEPPNYQFLAYNLALNSCTKTGTGVKYWTYDATFAAGYYKLNGGSTLLKLESTATTSDRGTKIDSFEALTCLSSYVTLTPQNDLLPSQYTLYVNGTPYTDFASGQRSYPVGSVIKVVYNSDNSVCGVTLNGNTYASGTEVTIVLNTDYTFVLKNYNHWVDYPPNSPYCQDNQSRQNIINDCGNTSYRVVSPCYTACTSTTYTETCSGTYGQNVLRTVYYACNGQATGQTSTYTCGSCSSTTQDWVTEGYACKTGDCTKWANQRQMNPCAAGYNTTREVDTNVGSCDCGEACLGTYEEQPFCDPNNPTTAIYVTKYVCAPNSVVSSRSVSCSSACGANTTQNWVNEGSVYCVSCVRKQLQRQMNPCAADYYTTRVINVGDGSPSCTCGQTCLGTYDYYYCTGTTRYVIPRYTCTNADAGSAQLVGTCSAACGASTTPNWVNSGDPYCVSGSCTLRQNQVQTNPCAAGTTRTVDTGVVSESCGTWNLQYYCVGFNLWSQQVNSCTSATRNQTLVDVNSPDCGYVPPSYTAFDISTVGTALNVCTRPINTVAYCIGGSPTVGKTIYTSSTGPGTLAGGYYNTNDGYIHLTSAGVVDATGIC